MPLIDVYGVEQFREYVNKAGLTLAYFTAVWCAPCRTASREVDRMTLDFPNVTFLKIDADSNEEIIMRCNVKVLPTFMIVREGQQLGYVIGGDTSEVKRRLRELASAPSGTDKPVATH
jgi:thioredoxin 1